MSTVSLITIPFTKAQVAQVDFVSSQDWPGLENKHLGSYGKL
jgi:hypothetical protein